MNANTAELSRAKVSEGAVLVRAPAQVAVGDVTPVQLPAGGHTEPERTSQVERIRVNKFAESAFTMERDVSLKNGVPMTCQGVLFHCKGGQEMQEALKGAPEERKVAVDNILAATIAGYVSLGQAAMCNLTTRTDWSRTENLPYIKEMLEIKYRCDSQLLRSIDVMTRLNSLPGIIISSRQVNVANVQQVLNGNRDRDSQGDKDVGCL